MTDPTQNPYAPPPAPGAGAPPVPPAPPASSVPPVPPAPTANPLGYQPPPAPQQQATPYGYSAPAPAPAPVPSPAGRKQTSPQTSSIISIIAGAVSIVILPWVAGFLGIGMGVYTLRAQATARRHGVPSNGAHTTMAIIGIVLGSIGILAKLALDYFL